MKTQSRKMIVIAMTILTLIGINVFGADYKTLINLAGNWKFNTGDDMKWADAKFNDKDWDYIRVPGNWEDQGYVGYDGFAWYRKKVVIPESSKGQNLIIQISNIDDADQIYFNGQLIGSLGTFPPSYLTGWGMERRYLIPVSLIKLNAENQIAIRVYDDGGEGGIFGQVRICFDEFEDLLNLNLSGDWKFKLFNNKEWKNPSYDDSSWATIKVPMNWESQGYFTHDGYAWYRKSFVMPQDLANQQIYLVLGKIDDYDDVYFNGEKIGDPSMLDAYNPHHFHLFGNWNSNGDNYNSDVWTYRRVYEIPKKLIKTGTNTIAVRVYDFTGAGGIYEGPVGIMDKSNLNIYQEKYHRDENPVQSIFDFLFD